MQVRIKPGASIRGIRPEMAIACIVASEIIRKYGLRLTLTEGSGGTHSSGSLHYVFLAIDIRTNELTADQKQEMFGHLVQDLGAEFDVVLEADHIHVEFQPKAQLNR